MKIKIFFILHAFAIRNRRSNRIVLDILANLPSPAIEYQKTVVFTREAQKFAGKTVVV